MAINYVSVKGYIKNGKLEIDLPENAEEGEVEVMIPVMAQDDAPLSDEEIEALMKPNPKTGAEIVADLEESSGGYNALIGFDETDKLGVSPGQLIVAMMRTSMWDIYQDILKQCKVDAQS